MAPTDEQAFQFAVIIHSGLPPAEAILYFIEDAAEAAVSLPTWQRSRAVKKATLGLMGKPWHEMTLGERMSTALDLHYSSLAHYLFSHNYSDLGPNEKSKADTARTALEAKIAGQAGKVDAMTRFFDDWNSGRLGLAKPTPITPMKVS